MTIGEQERHELFRKLEGAIGERPTATLMAMLGRAGREDWATKQDIVELRGATQQDIAELRAATKQDIAELRSEMHRALRGQLLAMAALIAAFNGTIFAALKLT